jgi:hypothetical protein
MSIKPAASSLAELTAIAHRHAAAEAAGDLAATLATLEPDPIYELYPVGLRMTGLSLARRYYAHFFARVAPRIASYEMLGEWINELGVLQEYRVSIRYEDAPTRDFRIMGLLKFGDGALAGERLYAEEELLRILFEPLWGELEASDGRPADGGAPQRR